MSTTKRLPKATQSTLSSIRAESRAAGREEEVSEATVISAPPQAPDLTLRRARASLIVERFATYSALGGAIPLALVDSLSVGVTVYEMIEALAEHYETPFERDRAKALSVALIGALAAPGIGQLATGLLQALIPWAWIVGAAASSASAAMFTRYVGEAFVNHFESGGTALDVDVTRIRVYVQRRVATYSVS